MSRIAFRCLNQGIHLISCRSQIVFAQSALKNLRLVRKEALLSSRFFSASTSSSGTNPKSNDEFSFEDLTPKEWNVSSKNITNEINEETNQISPKEFLRQNDIVVKGRDAPGPYITLEECSWPPEIVEKLEKQNITAPTPIQAQTWPIVLHERDLVGIAQTGSGKTLGYILPAFVKLMNEVENIKGHRVLVLAPTRELAQQIQAVTRDFKLFRSVCLFGGASRNVQMNALRETNAPIVIATPGRLNDFIENGFINLMNINYLVLDEADRMLDMGFEPQIRKIIRRIPEKRQTLVSKIIRIFCRLSSMVQEIYFNSFPGICNS